MGRNGGIGGFNTGWYVTWETAPSLCGFPTLIATTFPFWRPSASRLYKTEWTRSTGQASDIEVDAAVQHQHRPTVDLFQFSQDSRLPLAARPHAAADTYQLGRPTSRRGMWNCGIVECGPCVICRESAARFGQNGEADGGKRHSVARGFARANGLDSRSPHGHMSLRGTRRWIPDI